MSACGFTTDVLDWSAWIEPVRLEDASADQLAVLEESGPHARGSQYYHLLLHDASALRERSKLFNAIMYGAKGLRRADRELGATVESIENGCIYCTSVHARFYQQLAKKPEVVDALFKDGPGAPLEPRERAIADFSLRLAHTPPQASRDDILALRRAGLSNAEILDLANAVAMFAWANRLMLTLGEPKAAASE
ncbi:MAG TPA: peroxidase-related enzyme [Roseiarcus sp.]|nr:peroxidase-related enzyme [Roseiarcus sp.]